MTKEEIVKYVMQSPENTNPTVLEGMLEELNGGGGDYKKELLIDAIYSYNDKEDCYDFAVPSNLNIQENDYILSIIDKGYMYTTIKNGSNFVLYVSSSLLPTVSDIVLRIKNEQIIGGKITGSSDLNNYSNIKIYKLVPTELNS